MADYADKDPLWTTYNIGIRDIAGPAQIGVSGNLVSSSFRAASPELIAIHDAIRYERYQSVTIERLDRIWDKLKVNGDIVHLKVDTQGFEENVIRGARRILDQITSIRLEVAVEEVYEGEMTVPKAINMMRNLGFVLIDAWPAWRHPHTNEVLRFDLMFRKRT